jgi:hypothetical protein
MRVLITLAIALILTGLFLLGTDVYLVVNEMYINRVINKPWEDVAKYPDAIPHSEFPTK